MFEMLLAEVNNDKIVKVVSIDSGKGAKQRLLSLGLHINDIVEIVSNPRFGPVLIKNLSKNNARIAIGRGIAEKIQVEYVN
jgi:Fe2+ transport system protein FeoA